MKKIGVCLLAIVLVVTTCVLALVSCSDVTQSISYNNVIESKYGDAFVDTEVTAAPQGAAEYSSVPRVTRKFIIDGRIVGSHILGLYMPRGENVTFKIDSAEIGNGHIVGINQNCPLTEVPFKIYLDSKEKTYQRTLAGGMLELIVGEGAATTFELTVSGCVDMSYYRYGIDDEPEFKNIANYNVLECTNVRLYVPSAEYAKIKDAKKVMNWWRNAVVFMDQLLGLSFYAGDYSPMCIYFRNTVAEDDIVDANNNCIYLPIEYLDSLVDYEKLSEDLNKNVCNVLRYIAQEKIAKTNAFDDTYLKDYIAEILAQVTYVDTVDLYVSEDDVRYPLSNAGNLETILKGEFNNDAQRYCALFNFVYYNSSLSAVLNLLNSIKHDKLSDALTIAQYSKMCEANMKPLADKLGISLYGEDIVKMQQYDEYKLVANKATFGRDYKAAQGGYHVKIGEYAKFDFKSMIVADEEYDIEGVYGQEGAWAKLEDGTYRYTPSENKLKDSYRLNLITKDGKAVSLYGNITVDIAVSEYDLYNNVSFTTLEEAIKKSKELPLTSQSSITTAAVPKEEQESETKSFAIARGAIEVEENGTYTLYLKSSGLCSVHFGVTEYISQIFNNSLTVKNYTDELSYVVKLEKGFKYNYIIYNLSNQGSGFATLGIKKPDGEIEDIGEDYLIYPKLTRSDIVEYVNEQKYIQAISQQEAEYTPVKTAKLAQFMNIDDYKVGEKSKDIEKNSKVSFVLPFAETSVVNYVRIKAQGMNGVNVKVYGGNQYKQLIGDMTLSSGDNTIVCTEMNIDGVRLEFTSSETYNLYIKELEAGEYVSPMSIVPSTSTDIEYISEWTSSKDYIAINGSLAITKSKDSELSYSFNGNEISIYATIGPMFGTAKITIDGQDKGVIDLNSIKVNCSQLVYTEKLKDGDHVLKISAVDETPINFDYLAVAALGETVNKNDFSKLWYVSFIPGIVIIACIVFVALDIKEKKKSKKIDNN